MEGVAETGGEPTQIEAHGSSHTLGIIRLPAQTSHEITSHSGLVVFTMPDQFLNDRDMYGALVAVQSHYSRLTSDTSPDVRYSANRSLDSAASTIAQLQATASDTLRRDPDGEGLRLHSIGAHLGASQPWPLGSPVRIQQPEDVPVREIAAQVQQATSREKERLLSQPSDVPGSGLQLSPQCSTETSSVCSPNFFKTSEQTTSLSTTSRSTSNQGQQTLGPNSTKGSRNPRREYKRPKKRFHDKSFRAPCLCMECTETLEFKKTGQAQRHMAKDHLHKNTPIPANCSYKDASNPTNNCSDAKFNDYEKAKDHFLDHGKLGLSREAFRTLESRSLEFLGPGKLLIQRSELEEYYKTIQIQAARSAESTHQSQALSNPDLLSDFLIPPRPGHIARQSPAPPTYTIPRLPANPP